MERDAITNQAQGMMIRVISFGTCDLFHIGHLHLLESARAAGDHLTVGNSTDTPSFAKKAIYPVHPQQDRLDIVAGIKCVDDILMMGHDREGRFDGVPALCKVHCLPPTKGISITGVKPWVAILPDETGKAN